MKYIKWLLVIAWMLLIFHFSNETGTVSTETSQFFVTKIELFIKNMVPIFSNEVTFLVRKGAHITLYFILGILVLNASYGKKQYVLLSIFICLLYACSDEIHQLFVMGRSGNVKDVFIDMVGSSLGIWLTSYWHKKFSKIA